jgi:hypothetical protein
MYIFLCTLALLLCSLSALAQNNHAPTRVGGTIPPRQATPADPQEGNSCKEYPNKEQ